MLCEVIDVEVLYERRSECANYGALGNVTETIGLSFILLFPQCYESRDTWNRTFLWRGKHPNEVREKYFSRHLVLCFYFIRALSVLLGMDADMLKFPSSSIEDVKVTHFLKIFGSSSKRLYLY